MSAVRTILLVALIASLTAICRADIVTLLDGSEHEGEIIRENSDIVVLRMKMGGIKGSIVISRCDVSSIVVKPVAEDVVAVQGERLERDAGAIKEAPKAAEAWLRVAEFYSKHIGYSSQAHAAFERVLIFNPNEPQARARLGYIKQSSEWVVPQKPKTVEPPAPIGVKAAAALPPDELVIGLRRDEDLIKKLQGEQAARQRAEQDARRVIRESEPPVSYGGYASNYFYIGPYGSTYYYVPYGGFSDFGACGGYSRAGFGYSPYERFPGASYGLGTYIPYGRNYSSSGYGLGVNFNGRIGNVHVNGSLNSGSSFYGGGLNGGGFRGGNNGVMRYGF
jgi:hypothetical protein